MPTDRVLIEIITAANMAGIDQAQKGMLSMNVATLALAATLGVLVVVGKAGIENYKSQEEALNLLNQAATTQHDNLAQVRQITEEFISTNARFIKNQYDVYAAMGQIIRAGHGEVEAIRILNDALDWSVLKHEQVSEAATVLIKVLAGNGRALKELGITTAEYTAIQKKKESQEKKDAELLALIELRTAKLRDTTGQTEQTQNKLTIAWQNFTAKEGPSLLQMWGKLNEAMSTGLDILTIYLDLIQKIHDLGGAAFNTSPGAAAQNFGASGFNSRGQQNVDQGSSKASQIGHPDLHRTAQDSINASQIEHHEISRRTPTAIHIHIAGLVSDGPTLDRFANEIVRRLAMAPGI